MSAVQGQTPPAGDTGDKTEAANRSKGKDGPEDRKEAVNAVDGSVAAILAGAVARPALSGTKALLAAGETGTGDATAITGTAASVEDAITGGGNTQSARHKGPTQIGPDLKRSDAITASKDSNQNGMERTAGTSKTEYALAANAALAESAASGKILSAGRDTLEPGAALDAPLVQRHALEAPLPAGMILNSTAPSQTAQTATATIATHVAAPGWDRGLGEKVVWMAGQQIQVAQLHLNPPELGPLQITLTVNNDQASAQFVSHNASVREAIEAAMPRLREMLAEGGITLGNANVSADAFRDQTQQDSGSHRPRGTGQADMGGTFGLTQSLRATRGLVDIFA